MTKLDEKKDEKSSNQNEKESIEDELTIEEKLKVAEDKLLRTLAEMENFFLAKE